MTTRKSNFFMSLAFLSILFQSLAQEIVPYKKVDDVQLYIEVHSPKKLETAKNYPALVFFFGGGWKGGDRHHFLNHAQYFSKRGLVCFLVDYRTESQNGTTPFESLKDAKSAIRFIRKNSEKFGIDEHRIIAAGGSAGGHLAAATALIQEYNEETDDVSISCRPQALILFNPVIDNGPGGYGYERIGDAYPKFSPLHNIEKGVPPTLILLGTNDHLIPVATAEYYKTVMGKVGSRCELRLYPGKGHGFFNYNYFDMYQETIKEADLFLQSLGYLKESPKIEIE